MLVPLGAFYLQLFDAGQTTPPNLEAFSTGEGTVEVTAHVMREGIVRDSPFGFFPCAKRVWSAARYV